MNKIFCFIFFILTTSYLIGIGILTGYYFATTRGNNDVCTKYYEHSSSHKFLFLSMQ